MINIKATKAQAPSNEPSRERYLQKAGAVLGKMPVHLALILTAAVLYLQSFVRSSAAESDAPGEARPTPPEPSAGSTGEQNMDAPVAAQPEQPSVPTDKAAIGATIRSEAPSFVMLDSPSIDFAISPVAVRTNKGAFEFRPKSSNDNIGASVQGHGGSAASGGAASQGGGRAQTDPSGGGGEEEEDADDDDTPVLNRAPRTNGSVVLGDFVSGQAAFITFAALLQNASDPDGDHLAIGDVQVSSGALQSVQGGWIYTAAAGETGPQSITYTIHDAAHAIPQIARFQVVAEPAVEAAAMSDTAFAALPTDENASGSGDTDAPPSSSSSAVTREAQRLPEIDAEVLYGTAGDDTIHGGPGDEVVFARRGNDVVRAGAGDDRLFGEEGDDVLHGEDGNDFLSGGPGNDVLDGGAGEDEIDGGDGDDVIVATLDAANDTYSGGEGNDTLDLSATNVGVIADLIAGTVASTEIGMDVAAGIERIISGHGDDTLIAANDTTANHYEGGGGTDTLDLSSTHLGVLVDLTTGVAIGVEIGQDEHSGFETIFGGSGDDTFVVGAEAVLLRGGDGDDDFHFSTVTIGSDQSPVAHQIQDFQIGDRIYISDHFRISGQVAEDVKDLFEEIYGEDRPDTRPIRYRNERVDEMDRTKIEADLDGDTVYELAINLDGHHVLFIADNIA